MSMLQAPLHVALLALGVSAATPAPPAPAAAPVVSAIVEQCVPAASQAERSVTFSGQMTAIAGAQRMAMRIDVQERTPTEAEFHTVLAPGLGVWRLSDPGVKIYKYLKQVTNVAAPAAFRAIVRYRWLDDRGRVLRRTERRTPVCRQPVDIPKAPARMPGT
ncbi:MAG TPA: hypothetical protein VID29_07640 [Solirubrobacteraceae bacterium]|jgi:hypothetical protein